MEETDCGDFPKRLEMPTPRECAAVASAWLKSAEETKDMPTTQTYSFIATLVQFMRVLTVESLIDRKSFV